MDIHYWYCGNCFNSYLEKPKQCVNVGVLQYGRYPYGCEKYPMKEATIRNVVAYEEYSTEIQLGIIKADGTETEIYFSGDEEVWARREAFMKLIGKKE